MRYLDGLAVDELFARTSSGGTLAWYLTDQLGSVTDLVSSSGTDLDHIVYDPYGNIVTETNSSNGDRSEFAGMEYDSTTGIYYDHARYYDAAVGRFISQDPKGFAAGDANLYRYVGNAPTIATDPTGTQDGGGVTLNPVIVAPGPTGGILFIPVIPVPGPNGGVAFPVPRDYPIWLIPNPLEPGGPPNPRRRLTARGAYPRFRVAWLVCKLPLVGASHGYMTHSSAGSAA